MPSEYILYLICVWSFLLLPPLALVLKYVKKIPLTWLLFFIILPVFSWICTNGAVYFYYEHLGDVISQHGDNCPPELLDEWSADGAKHAVAFFFGWAYGIIYSVPWLILYLLAVEIRSLIRKKEK